MTNTSTRNIEATVEQIKRLSAAGCQIVRVTTPTLMEVESLKIIKQHLAESNINIPLVADVHFSPVVARHAATVADKVRINPGNYLNDTTKEHYSEADFMESRRQIANNIQPLLKVCKQHNTALRIGVNQGSLSKRILYRYGNTPKGMVASALEFMEILLESGFQQFTLSLKASDVRIMQEANIMLVKQMIKKDVFFPLHLGVTEAGDGNDGRIKSAAGIGSLLQLGIGDTIRVSLTEDPEAEVLVAKKVLSLTSSKGVALRELESLTAHAQVPPKKIADEVGHSKPYVVSRIYNGLSDMFFKDKTLCFNSGKPVNNLQRLTITSIHNSSTDFETLLLEASILFASDFLKKGSQAIFIKNVHFNTTDLTKLSLDILQGMGLRYSKTEYIACPSCGRTLFNIMDQLKKVREKTSRFKGLKIAVMGCIVNGPGEMAGADYGLTGSGKGKITLYKLGKPVVKNIPEEQAAEALLELIENDTKTGRSL